ncbi:hypothetical protein V8E36_008721 [Tilletia maclaganii]
MLTIFSVSSSPFFLSSGPSFLPSVQISTTDPHYLSLHTSHATGKDRSRLHRPRCRPSPGQLVERNNKPAQTIWSGSSSRSTRAQVHVQQQQRQSARSAVLGPGDSDDDCIDSDVSEPAKKTAKKMSLTNWATNTLGEMTYTYIEGNNKGYEIGEDKWLLGGQLMQDAKHEEGFIPFFPFRLLRQQPHSNSCCLGMIFTLEIKHRQLPN